jgi:hypothetical protein
MPPGQLRRGPGTFATNNMRRNKSMKHMHFTVGLLAVVWGMAARVNAQLPSGSDINSSIPIYFGQSVSDLGDSATAPERVYSITLAKGQQVTGTLSVANTAPSAVISLGIWSPGTLSLAGCGYCNSGALASGAGNAHAVTFSYTASTSGVYYVKVGFGTVSVNYTVQVNATGTPLGVPNPTSAGCLNGQVDSITYSLQLIAAGLPDSASIGGTQMCSSCSVKAPAYPQIVDKMENALALNVPVSACYDASGSLFQITLKHP